MGDLGSDLEELTLGALLGDEEEENRASSSKKSDDRCGPGQPFTLS